MATITPQNGTKFTNIEKKQIKNAELIATKLQKIYKETQRLMMEAGSNPFLVKKGVAVTCNGKSEQVANRVIFTFDCMISVPEEIVK